MATDKELYTPTHPGAKGLTKIKKMHVPALDGAGSHMAAFMAGRALEKYVAPIIGCGVPVGTGHWTTHVSGTGATVAHSSGKSTGLKFTTPTDDNFNMSYQSLMTWDFSSTNLDGKWVCMIFRVHVDDIANIGFALGLGNTQVQNFTTDFTNKVVFNKAIAAGAVTGVVRSASGTARATGTLGTLVNDTEVELAVTFKKGATAAASAGAWWYNGTKTAFTSDQLTALAALTGALQFTVNCTGVTGASKNMTVAAGYGDLDK